MQILALDPGPEQTAWVIYEAGVILDCGKEPNADVRNLVKRATPDSFGPALLAVEMVASYGMPVGREVFDTCVWIGRFLEAWRGPCRRIYRHDVKMHLCHRTAKVTDAVIRQALIDRFGPGKDKAIGRKSAPGPLYWLRGDEWAALGVALAAEWQEQNGVAAA